LGAIIAVGCLDAITPSDNYVIDPRSAEYAFGDYSSGRFVWHFNDMRGVAPIHGIRGHLGLWTPTPDLHDMILRSSGHDKIQPTTASHTPMHTRRETSHDLFGEPVYLTGRLKKP
jgi:hypothetical protein